MTRVVPLVLVLLALARPAAAQTPAPRAAGEPAFTTTGAFIAMSVPDLEASVRWYVEKLGMRVVTELPPNDGYAVRILEGGGLIAEIMHTPAASPLRTLAPSVAHTTAFRGADGARSARPEPNRIRSAPIAATQRSMAPRCASALVSRWRWG